MLPRGLKSPGYMCDRGRSYQNNSRPVDDTTSLRTVRACEFRAFTNEVLSYVSNTSLRNASIR